MSDAFTNMLAYIGLAVTGILIWAAFSPFEVLGWWAGWFGDTIHEPGAAPPPGDNPRAREHNQSDADIRATSTQVNSEQTEADRPAVAAYVVFLSGVARVSGESFSYRERDFLQRLANALPQARIIDDIFPYSVNNLPLTGQPFFARLWRFALRSKLSGRSLAGNLINLRNIWQVMISADKRYGPMFNQAIAQVILHALMRHGYEPRHAETGRAVPLFVIGYSGAGQVSVGATTYLKEYLDVPIYTISLGGVFASDPGVMAADRVFHLYGTRDRVHKYGLFAPGRWSIFPGSAWNRAKREGRVEMIGLGPMCHTGRGGYLDAKTELPDGTPYIDATVHAIRRQIESVLTQSAPHTA